MDDDGVGNAVRQQSGLITGHTREYSRRSSSAVAQVWPAVVAGLMLWMVVVTVRGVVLVAQALGIPFRGEPRQGFAAPALLTAAGFIVLSCLAIALAARRFRPATTLPITCAAGGLVLLAAAVSTGSLGPLLLVLAFFAIAWVLGYFVLCRLPSPPAHPIISLPVAIALGLGIGGLLLFLLASIGWLNAATVLLLAIGILTAALLLDRHRLAADFARLRAWQPQAPTWLATIMMGVAVGALAFALLADFVPEYDSDASRDHLPVAREIWQSGTVGEFPPFTVSQDPVLAHLLYAVTYGLAGEGYAGIAVAKLVHAGVGLAAIIGIASLGWLCSGRVAAAVGATLFATTPLVLWGVGHPSLDLFPVLFTVAALLCLVHWQRVGMPPWLVGAGALAGFGFGAKISMAWVVVALAAAIFLVGREPWQFRGRTLAVLAFGLGTVVVVPWLARSYSIAGTLPGLGTIVHLFTSVLSELGMEGAPGIGRSAGSSAPGGPISGAAVAGLPRDANRGHSLIALVQSPWLLTFHAGQYTPKPLEISPIGIAPLLLVPMALLGPRTRPVVVLVVTAVVSYIGWWITPHQLPRHLLPTLGVVAVLVGIGVAGAVGWAASPLRHPLAQAARTGALIGLIAGLLLFLPERLVGISIDRLTGRETAAEYVSREIPGAAMLAATSDLLPPDTPVGYVGAGEYAEIYSEARLMRLPARIFSSLPSEATPADVLAVLDRRGIDFVMWDRARTKSEDWRWTLLSTEFLRDHSRILAGDGNAYLFELLPDGSSPWGAKDLRNLLDDPGFDKVKGTDGPWTMIGTVKARDGRITMRKESAIAQRVPVAARTSYLLSAAAACSDSNERAELRLRWFDDDGDLISTAAELVVPGTEGSEQFLWRRAPEGATSVSVELASQECAFDAAALYDLS